MLNMRRFLWLSGTFAAAVSLSVSSPLFAQSDGQPDLEQLSRNLDDAEVSFRYARGAAAAGDTKGAIAALERVLQINPDLANIKLELGLLYLKIGQADLARSYLEAAVSAPDAPEESRIRARQALRTAQGQLSPLRFSGGLFAGLQYQSNPNGSPDAVSVQPQVPGLPPIIISGDQLDIPTGNDFSLNFAANVEAALGLGGQKGHELVFDTFASQSWYRDTSELDLTFLQGRFGPRLTIGNSLTSSGLVRPYVLGSALLLDDHKYFGSIGGGIDLLFRPSLVTSVAVEGRYEDRKYRNSPLRATASEQSGDYWSGQVTGTWQFEPRTRLSAGLNGQVVSAARPYQSRNAIGGQLGIGHALAPPVGTKAWFATATASYRHTRYDAPDPLVDADTRRRENRFDVTAALSIPLTGALVLEGRLQQTWSNANLPNYDFDNTIGSLGLSLRF